MEHTTKTNKNVCMNMGSWSLCFEFRSILFQNRDEKKSSHHVHGVVCIY